MVSTEGAPDTVTSASTFATWQAFNNQNIAEMYETNPVEFTLLEGASVSAYGKLSTLKVKIAESTEFKYWWGYSQQINVKAQLGTTTIFEAFADQPAVTEDKWYYFFNK
jgi:hypothetical protein